MLTLLGKQQHVNYAVKDDLLALFNEVVSKKAKERGRSHSDMANEVLEELRPFLNREYKRLTPPAM